MAALALAVMLGAACAPGGQDADLVGSTATTSGVGGSGQGGQGSTGADPNCAEQPCKLVPPQCGCADGERCTISAETQRVCLPNGDKAITEACGECQAGAICMNNGAGAPQICHQFCATDEDCPGDGGLCNLTVDNGVAKACSNDCDPIALTGCAEAATKCELFKSPDDGPWYTLCGGVGMLLQGDPCAIPQDCAAGLSCIATNQTDKTCLTWCDVANPLCPALTICEGFDPPILVGAREYGVCVP